eukprot:6473716-Amphidinium_carterae.1
MSVPVLVGINTQEFLPFSWMRVVQVLACFGGQSVHLYCRVVAAVLKNTTIAPKGDKSDLFASDPGQARAEPGTKRLRVNEGKYVTLEENDDSAMVKDKLCNLAGFVEGTQIQVRWVNRELNKKLMQKQW